MIIVGHGYKIKAYILPDIIKSAYLQKQTKQKSENLFHQ